MVKYLLLLCSPKPYCSKLFPPIPIWCAHYRFLSSPSALVVQPKSLWIIELHIIQILKIYNCKRKLL